MPNYTKEILGIIGGCGVAAANELICRIEKKLIELGCSDDSQQPETILYQATLAPSRIAFASGQSEISFVPHFVNVGKKLKACGATLCCIPCNTAHCAIEEIEREIGLPFLNIIKETLDFISQKHDSIKNVGILGSSGTKISKIHETHAKKFGYDFKFLFPDDKLQQSIDEGIAAVKRGLQYSSPSMGEAFFSEALEDLLTKKSEAIVLGCTEIPLAIRENFYKGIPLVDTLTILAEACIRECKN